jgi:hypothetical protein
MIPTFALPGDSAPGQFGPIIVTSRARMYAWMRSISWAGMPSVIAITVCAPASIAS